MTRAPNRTRDAIVTAALELFRERGFHRTTMRAVAERAEVSVGNAYYYFSSKEQLVQGFYDQLVAEHRERALPGLAHRPDLTGRLDHTLRTWLAAAEPYRAFAGQFFAQAAQPDNPLSPFSAESSVAREDTIDLYRRVLGDAVNGTDPELAAQLPELLWLFHLGVVLFWVHDSSPGNTRTHQLIDRATPLVARLIRMSRLPALRPLSRQVIGIAQVIRGSG